MLYQAHYEPKEHSIVLSKNNEYWFSIPAAVSVNDTVYAPALVRQTEGKIELFGTKSGAKIDPGVELYTDMAGMFVNIQPQGNTTFDATNPFNAEIRGFINAAMNGGECRATAEDGVALMKILDAIYESAATGKSVDIQ